MLASVLVLSNALCVSAETGNDAAENTVAVQSGTDVSGNDVSGGNAGIPTPAPAEKTKLAAPAEISWGYNFTITFKAVPEAYGYYDVEYIKDDEVIGSTQWHFSGNREFESIDFNQYVMGSGDYKVRMRSSNRYDYETYENSDWVESTAKSYTRPEAELGTTTGYWDDATPGLLHYTTVEGAGGYDIDIYYTNANGYEHAIGGRTSRFGRTFKDQGGRDVTVDMSSFIERSGAGLYRATIRALSSDVKTIANGYVGEFSPYYDTTKTAAEVSSTVKDALANSSSAQEALEAVKENISTSALKTAMQTDAETLAQVKELEERYTKENNISVEAPAVSSAAADYVDPGKINMVGAGLNAKSGAVQLSVGVPEKPEYVNDKFYKKTVQLSIELKNENASIHELEVPITITMPVPAGLNTETLAILHYHQDGSVESVTLKNNGDGTVTFTVTNFSTFVFAEKNTQTEEIPDHDDVISDDSDNNSSEGGSTSSTSFDWNETTINVDWAAASTQLDTAIKAANGANVNVLTGKDVKVSADVLKKIAGQKVTLALQTGNGVALSVSGQNNKQIKEDLNLTVTNKDTVPAQIKNAVMTGVADSKNILITENSPLQVRTGLHVGFSKEYAGKFANLYFYDAKSGQMKLVGIFQINKDGQSMFALSHGGQYVVTVTNAASTAVAAADGYTVVSGDTMSGIARKLGTSLKALKTANPQIADLNKIRPGQVVRIQ